MIWVEELILVGNPSRDSVLSTSGFGEERYSRIDEDMAIVTGLQERNRKLGVSEWKYEQIFEFP